MEGVEPSPADIEAEVERLAGVISPYKPYIAYSYIYPIYTVEISRRHLVDESSLYPHLDLQTNSTLSTAGGRSWEVCSIFRFPVSSAEALEALEQRIAEALGFLTEALPRLAAELDVPCGTAFQALLARARPAPGHAKRERLESELLEALEAWKDSQNSCFLVLSEGFLGSSDVLKLSFKAF